MLKAAVSPHAIVQGVLPGVAKRRMAQVMGQGNRFHQVFVQTQGARHGAAQLRHLQRMGHAGAEQVALVVQKHLGFVDQPAKSTGMDDAVPVALEFGARGRRSLGEAPTPAVGRVAGIR